MNSAQAAAKYDIYHPDTFCEILITYVILLFLYGGFLLELSCLILFVNHFVRKTQYFCSGYFYLLSVGYAVDMLSIFFNSAELYFGGVDIVENASNVVEWYSSLFLGTFSNNHFVKIKNLDFLLLQKNMQIFCLFNKICIT